MAQRLFVMVGIPGSGKTTHAKRHFRHALRISLDDLRLMMLGRTFDAAGEPYVAAAGEALLETCTRQATAWKKDILFDATNVTRERRKKLIESARRNSLVPVAVYVVTSLEVALDRNRRRQHPVPEEVVRSFFKRLDVPTIEEGFEQVIVVDAGERNADSSGGSDTESTDRPE